MFFGAHTQPRQGRHVRTRVQVFFRIDPRVAESLLPEGTRPRLWRGAMVGELRFTRLKPGGSFLGPLAAKSDHYSCRLPVEHATPDGPRPGTFLLTRKASAWFEAMHGGGFPRVGADRPRFLVSEEPDCFSLLITDGHGRELELHSEACPRSASSLFPSARAVQGFLASNACVDPSLGDPDYDHPSHLVPEPLHVSELEARVLEALPPGSFAVDSAWRWLPVRRAELTETAFERRESALPAT